MNPFLKRRFLLKTIIVRFHVTFRRCKKKHGYLGVPGLNNATNVNGHQGSKSRNASAGHSCAAAKVHRKRNSKACQAVGKFLWKSFINPIRSMGLLVYIAYMYHSKNQRYKCIGKYTIYMEISWASGIANFCEHWGKENHHVFFV